MTSLHDAKGLSKQRGFALIGVWCGASLGRSQRASTIEALDKKPTQDIPLDGHRMPTLPGRCIPEPAPLPLGSRMPYAVNQQFIGREAALRELAAALDASETAAIGQVAAATGIGGIGKTQLAAAFVHRYGQFFDGGVFWLSFDEPAVIPFELASCGGPGHMELWQSTTDLDLMAQVAKVRSAWADGKCRLLAVR